MILVFVEVVKNIKNVVVNKIMHSKILLLTICLLTSIYSQPLVNIDQTNSTLFTIEDFVYYPSKKHTFGIMGDYSYSANRKSFSIWPRVYYFYNNKTNIYSGFESSFPYSTISGFNMYFTIIKIRG